MTEAELKQAFAFFKERIEMYSKAGLNDGFRRIDSDHKGSLSATELHVFFSEQANKPHFINDRTIAVLVDWADLSGDDCIDYNELSNVLTCDDLLAFAELVPDKKATSKAKAAAERPIGERGACAADVQNAQRLITDRLLEKAGTVRAVISHLDLDGSNTLNRDEIKAVLKNFHLLGRDPKTGKKSKSALTLAVVDTLIDVVNLVAAKGHANANAIKSEEVDLTAFCRLFDQDRQRHTIDILEVAGL